MSGDFNADGLHSESDLYLRNGATFKSVLILSGAKIDGDVDMIGASVGGAVNADKLQVGSSLYMRSEAQNKTSFKEVNLRGAKVTGQIDMTGASFDGKLDAESLQVGDTLLMYSEGQNITSFKDVNLRGAKITGDIYMNGASFSGTLIVDGLQASKDLSMSDVYCVNKTVLTFAHVGGGLDLRGATLASLDLSGASIVGDLRLGGAHKSAVWTGKNGEPGTLTLHNTQSAI